VHAQQEQQQQVRAQQEQQQLVRAQQEQHQQRLEAQQQQQQQGASIGALTQRLELLQGARKQVSAHHCLPCVLCSSP
jgi:hypothetical protein